MFYYDLVLFTHSCINPVLFHRTIDFWYSCSFFASLHLSQASSWSLTYMYVCNIKNKQSSLSFLTRMLGGGVLQMWKVGFWLHWHLWGTEVSQSRKWLDLPCGRLAHPGKNPHSPEHPGSPQAPTEDCKARAELLVKVAKTLNFAWPSLCNLLKDD